MARKIIEHWNRRPTNWAATIKLGKVVRRHSLPHKRYRDDTSNVGEIGFISQINHDPSGGIRSVRLQFGTLDSGELDIEVLSLHRLVKEFEPLRTAANGKTYCEVWGDALRRRAFLYEEKWDWEDLNK